MEKLRKAAKVLVVLALAVSFGLFLILIQKRVYEGNIVSLTEKFIYEDTSRGAPVTYDGYAVFLDTYPDKEFLLSKGAVENSNVKLGSKVRINYYKTLLNYTDALNSVEAL